MGRMNPRMIIARLHTLQGSSLLETVVASGLFLIVFMGVLSVLPQLSVDKNEVLHIAEAEYHIRWIFDKYAKSIWHSGEYVERYDWGTITVQLSSYQNFSDVRRVSVAAWIEGSREWILREKILELTE